ncbi:RNA polymerase sigma factor [Streptomyces sp. JJ36]|uniref:RNA polymerase sigma factor n=1 Tax=Streptomyces sp. JJ36 TaxID=2736645 RepID=UPI001F1ECE73|nr:hypothetical protein [Streptomyces sp. JJ36]MCF6525161.1 hypothetical protein [Streptomyces sp. JJ36]
MTARQEHGTPRTHPRSNGGARPQAGAGAGPRAGGGSKPRTGDSARSRTGSTARPRSHGRAEPQAGGGGRPRGGSAASPRPGSPEEAFDLLHAHCARALTRQAYLLCGHRRLAERAVVRAFHLAWHHWPAVAVDRDPVGWVRAAVHDQALSPWLRFPPGRRRRAQAHAGPPCDRMLQEALLALPAPARRAVLLHDGLGVSLAATAAETEASTAATVRRVEHAREALGAGVPELAGAAPHARPALLAARLRELGAAHPVRTAPAPRLRAGAEWTARRWTRTACALTAALATAAGSAVLLDAGAGDAAGPGGAGRGAAVALGRTPGLPGVREDGEPYAPHLRSANRRVRMSAEDTGTERPLPGAAGLLSGTGAGPSPAPSPPPHTPAPSPPPWAGALPEGPDGYPPSPLPPPYVSP